MSRTPQCRLSGQIRHTPAVTLLPGSPKLTLLNALKNSARNASETHSLNWVFLIIAKSVLKNPGPRRAFFPVLPSSLNNILSTDFAADAVFSYSRLDDEFLPASERVGGSKVSFPNYSR